MNTQRKLEGKLRAEFAPEFLEVVNESGQHSVPPGSETHFRVVLVSSAFAGRRSAQRHQKVYAVLAQELASGIHALALHTYTPEEWAQREGSAPQSPECMGGGKRSHA